MDLKSGAATCGGPEDNFYQMASTQIARHYGIRSIIGTFASGAKFHDWQVGMENGISGSASCLSGPDLFSGAGLLYVARVFSPLEMVLDAETFGLLARFKDGFSAEPEDMALEVVAAVGPGGHFVAEQHTLDHMHDFWQSEIFDREPWEAWDAAGRPDVIENARTKLRDILGHHTPEPLPDDVSKELDDIIARYTPLLAEGGDA
jgi:trimethylamine--corrinoid protein Co-methyltransferase